MNYPPEKAHLKALFDAYVAASGRTLTLSPMRERVLREFDRRGFSPEDVRAVLQVLRSRVERGVTGYTDASLDWTNAMANVDRFEERLALLRQARARKRGAAPKPDAPQTRRLPDGSTVTVLAQPTGDADAARIADEVRRQAAAWRTKEGVA